MKHVDPVWILAALTLVGIAGCDGAGPSDGSGAMPDDGGAGDSAATTSVSSGSSHRDSEGCEEVAFAGLWPDPVRVPLEALCQGQCARFTERSMGFTCEALEPDAIDDAGTYRGAVGAWKRSEGCGSVQYSTMPPEWPRIYNFDQASGELIGAAQLDDVIVELPGSTCRAGAFIAGDVRESCAEESITVCR